MQLVCPAGNLPALQAAIDAGADAVYAGFRDQTNARAFPGLNFSDEELRAGIASVRPQQHAAGLALGLRPMQVWRLVVLPQALRTALPPLLGQYMNALKNSSLAMAIGLAELSYASRQVETETFKTFQAFGIATLLYIGAIALIEAIGQAIQHSRRYRRGAA